MILNRYKNFLGESDCLKLVDYYQNHLNQTFKYNFTKPLSILKCQDPFVMDCLNKVIEKCNTLHKVYLDNAEIIKWLNDGYMDPHYDAGDKFAAVLYLNSNYGGGELVVENITIKPEVGELIIFENSQLLHSVNRIVGERFTLSSWYRTI